MGFAYGNRTEESWSEGGYYGCAPLPLLANNTVVEQPVDLSTVNERYTSAALDFVRSAGTVQPYFLYFAFGHVHTPQYASAAHTGASKRGIFGDSVVEVDSAVGAVLEAVAGTNTFAILSSDNGAPDAHQHLQAGQLIDAITGSNYGFLGSKTQTWEGGLRVPGIMWWPTVIAPQVVQDVASTLDVFATVSEAAGLALPKDRTMDSVSFLPRVTGKNATAPRAASFFYAGATLMAVRVGAHKAHLVTTMPNEAHAGPERNFLTSSGSGHAPYGVQKPWLFFNVEHDPGEMYSFGPAGDEDVAKAAVAAVAAHRAELGTPPPGILDHECREEDCRVCCDHATQCVCTPPPATDRVEHTAQNIHNVPALASRGL